MVRRILSIAFCCTMLGNAVWSEQQPDKVVDRVQAEAFFEKHIRPLLVDRCFECHNEDVQESQLRLDSLQAMIDGGERGPAIVPGNAKDSLLIHAVNHSEAELQMPEGDKLLAAEIKTLAKWIDDGTVWPGQRAVTRKAMSSGGPLFTEDEKNYWAFRQPQLPSPPKVKNEAWVQSEIDRFVLRKLEAAGLQPAPPTSKRSLIRRVYFDLVGLPPSPQAVQSFLNDSSPKAFEQLIDQLLASPRYGERWGRHWLDVARYADSNGLDENWAFEFIYRYRDWVIQSFNDDMPYDQFVTLQLAGDLVESKPNESLESKMARVAAAGFLSVGPKMIADDDPKKKKMDIIDEQLSTVAQTFMALTVGCARCHDHKFDPVPTWDYYAMASIFKSTKTMEHLRVVAPVSLHEFKPDGYDEKLAKYEARRKSLTDERDAFWKRVTNYSPNEENESKEFKLPKNADNAVPQEHRDAWKKLKEAVSEHEKAKPETLKVMAPTDGEIEELKVSLRGNYLTLGDQTRRQFLRVIDGEKTKPIESKQSGRLELAKWLTSPTHPLTSRVLVNRVWRWRFGRGIVSTVDNFGKLGERPTHPELLDWLATKFIEDGQSIKKLHKRMLLSSTYQMSTGHATKANAIDPENKLLWRFPRMRLEAESIRDAVLQVSDNLDFEMGGSMMPLKDRRYVTGTASKTQRYDNPRRTIYQPVYRSAVYDVLVAFDFPDPATPTGDRKTSVVAPQALLMMNSPLVRSSAKRIASELLNDFDSDEERINSLYSRTLSRSPTPHERDAILFHLDRTEELLRTSAGSAETDPRLEAWLGICRTVLSSNEFLYLD